MCDTESIDSTAARSLAEPSSAGSLLKVPLGRWRIRKGAWLWVSRSLYVARAVQEAIAVVLAHQKRARPLMRAKNGNDFGSVWLYSRTKLD